MDNLLFLLIACLATDFHHTEASSSDETESMTIPALSHPFKLGQLYDATKDTVVSGLDLWNQDTLDKHTYSKPYPNTASHLIVGTSFEQKAKFLGISAEIEVTIRSAKAGVINVGGSGSYLESKTSSNYWAEVTLQYHRRTHVAGMEALQKVDYPSVFGKDTGATHVVTEIEYGADAFLEFRKALNSTDQRREIEGQLYGSLKQIRLQVEGSIKLNLTDSEKKKFTKIACIFNGDVKLPNPPTTMLDAIGAYKALPDLINETTAVPITVHLTPISFFDSEAGRIVRQINKNLLNQVSLRFDQYDEIQLSVGDLVRSQAYNLLPQFQNIVTDFKSAVVAHKNKFQHQLLAVLPKIRDTSANESELVNILDKSRERFTIDQLSRWITLKQEEAGALLHLLSRNASLIVTKPGAFEKIIYNENNEYVIAFTLQLYPKDDTFIQCVANDCGSVTGSGNPCSKLDCAGVDESSSSWINDAPFASMLYGQFEKFLEVVDMNADQQSTVMVIRERNWQNDNGRKGARYSQITEVYHKVQLIEENFEPTIDQSLASHNCSESIVSWKIDGPGAKSTLLTGDYIVKHRPAADANWTEVPVNGQNQIHLKYAQNQDFEVVVLALCSFGVCGISDEVIYRQTADNPDCLPKPYSKILIVGGSSFPSSMEMYNPFNPQLNHVVKVNMLQYRSDHTSAVMDDGTVVTVGGYYSSYLTSCESFTPSTSKVTACPSLKTARRYAASSLLNGVLYVCGGHDGKTYLQSCERFLSDVWQGSVPMNTKRSALAMVSLNGSLYAIGGHDGSKVLSSVERRSVTDQQWTKVQSMNTARIGHSATVMGGQIYVCGSDNTCEQYDPFWNRWTNIAPMNQGRSFFGLVSDRFNLFALGGDSSRYLTVEMFDGKNRKWKMMKNELIYTRQHFSAVLVQSPKSLF